MTLDQQCARLRMLVQHCLNDQLLASASFYADKLVSISQAAPSDVYVLAQVCCPTLPCLPLPTHHADLPQPPCHHPDHLCELAPKKCALTPSTRGRFPLTPCHPSRLAGPRRPADLCLLPP